MLYEYIQNDGKKLSLNKSCELLQVSKKGYLKHLQTKKSDDKELVAKIESIVLEFHGYGYRRVEKELKRQQEKINHKKVLKLMNKHGLTVKKKVYKIKTTDSEHGLPVYPNLVKGLEIVRVNYPALKG